MSKDTPFRSDSPPSTSSSAGGLEPGPSSGPASLVPTSAEGTTILLREIAQFIKETVASEIAAAVKDHIPSSSAVATTTTSGPPPAAALGKSSLLLFATGI